MPAQGEYQLSTVVSYDIHGDLLIVHGDLLIPLIVVS